MAKQSRIGSYEQIGGVDVLRAEFAVGGAVTTVIDAAGHDAYEVINVDIIPTVNSPGACTGTVNSGTDAITNALDINQVSNTKVSGGTYDDAYNQVATGTALNLLRSTDVQAGVVYVTVIRI